MIHHYATWLLVCDDPGSNYLLGHCCTPDGKEWVSNGHALLAWRPAVFGTQPGTGPAIGKILADRPTHTTTIGALRTAALAGAPAGDGSLEVPCRVGPAIINLRLLYRYLVPVLDGDDAQVQVQVGGAKDPVRVLGNDWELAVMPLDPKGGFPTPTLNIDLTPLAAEAPR